MSCFAISVSWYKLRFFPARPHREVANLIGAASAEIAPRRADFFGDEAYSTKIMEFMSQGVPVVASRTRIDTYYFDDSIVRFFPSLDEASLARGLIDVLSNAKLHAELIKNRFRYVKRNN